jgi:hypothetical protein
MIIRITSKLAKKLNLPLSLIESGNEPSINEWYGNLFTFKRAQYILLTNEKTLFSFVFPGKGITNYNLFLKKMSIHLEEMLGTYDLTSVWEKHFMSEFNEVSISKTNNRAVLGSMNEIIFYAKCVLEKEEVSPKDLSLELNTIIYSLIKYKSPIEVFREFFKAK